MPGPHGQPYYYNSATLTSTYVRPVNPFQTVPVKQKQEKPLLKTYIPGTDWLRITTTGRNLFYFHKTSKKSTWIVPDELKATLEAFEAEEKAGFQNELTTGKSHHKRKADEPDSADKVVSKKAKLHESHDSESDSDEEEEEWRSKAAEQLAAEAEEIQKLKEEEQKIQDLEEAQRAFAANEIVMPRTVDLSLEEAKALFKVCFLLSRSFQLILLFYRLYFGRKILILYIHGIHPFRNSFLIPDMYFYLLSLLVERLLMSTAKNESESCESRA
jgi:hypothetical protein